MVRQYKDAAGNIVYKDDDVAGYFYVYLIVGLLLLMAFGGGGRWYYNNNYSDAAKLAKSAAISANSANVAANAAINAAAGANSAQADKAAADAAIAASAASAAAASTKKAADDANLAAAQKSADDAKKADEAAKAALEKVKTCKSKLNLFQGTNGKTYICPPMYNFGNQNRFNDTRDLWAFKRDNIQGCWMTDGARSDCAWGANSCDPSTYTTPNGKKISKIYANGVESNDLGNIQSQKYDDVSNTVYAIKNPMEYSDTEYCSA